MNDRADRPMAVLVTGGASGIGLAVVEAALAEGWRAVVADLPGAALEAARDRFDPAQVRCMAMDVSDEAAVVAAVAGIEAGFAPLTGAVNSAGIGLDRPMMETGLDVFRRILDVNVVGSFAVGRAVARRMRGRGGAIVNIASVSGIRGNEGRVAYGASKGAVLNMSRVMAVELAPLGIRVNVVAPGPVETPMVARLHTPEARASWTATVPMRRYGTPAEIAAAAIFLLDPAKSGYITGQVLSVDGGFTAAGIMTGTTTVANAEG